MLAELSNQHSFIVEKSTKNLMWSRYRPYKNFHEIKNGKKIGTPQATCQLQGVGFRSRYSSQVVSVFRSVKTPLDLLDIYFSLERIVSAVYFNCCCLLHTHTQAKHWAGKAAAGRSAFKSGAEWTHRRPTRRRGAPESAGIQNGCHWGAAGPGEGERITSDIQRERFGRICSVWDPRGF